MENNVCVQCLRQIISQHLSCLFILNSFDLIVIPYLTTETQQLWRAVLNTDNNDLHSPAVVKLEHERR